MRTDDDKYKKLLDEIIDPARTYPRLKGEVFSLQAFAKFLSELAKDAGEQTERNLVIQRRLVGATWLIFVLTLLMFALQFFQVLGNHPK